MSTSIIGFEGNMGQESRDYGREAMLRRIGALARRRREELGLSRVTFVEQAGMGSSATVRDFEFGRIEPQSRTLTRMEKALGWRAGSILEMMSDPHRKASSVEMEDLDEHDSKVRPGLAQFSLQEILREAANRIEALQAGLGGSAGPGVQNMYGLAASGGHKPEHLDDDPDDDISGLNVSPN